MNFLPKKRFLHFLCSSVVIKLAFLSFALVLICITTVPSEQYERNEPFDDFKNAKNYTASIFIHDNQLDPYNNDINNKIQDLDDHKDYRIKVKQSMFEYLVDNLIINYYPGVKDYTIYTTKRLKIKPLSHVKPLRPDFGPVINDVTSIRYPIQIRPCFRSDGTEKKTIFVAIVSAPENFSKREILRQTWISHLLNPSKTNSEFIPVGIGFVLGLTKNQTVQRQVEEESKKFDDVLQMDIIDDYYNLTQKSVGIANWINRYCSFVDFVLKADDDMFVNVRNLESMIVQLNSSELAIYGSKNDRTPLRNQDSKFFISFDEWPWSKYPNYVAGSMVIITGRAIEILLAAAQTTPFLPFEDVYFNGLCTEKSGVEIRFSKRMMWKGVAIEPCVVHEYVSWLTSSEESMMEIQLLTELFYTNITPCFINGPGITERVVNPLERTHFIFNTPI